MTCAPLTLDVRGVSHGSPPGVAAFRLLVVAFTDPRPPRPGDVVPAFERLLAASADLQRDGHLDVELMADPDASTFGLALRDGDFDGLHLMGPVSASATSAAPAQLDVIGVIRDACRGSATAPGLAFVDLTVSDGGEATAGHFSVAAVADQLVAAGVRGVIAIAGAWPGAAHAGIARAAYRGFAEGAAPASIAEAIRRRLPVERLDPAAPDAIAVREIRDDNGPAGLRVDGLPGHRGTPRPASLPGREPILRSAEAAIRDHGCRAVVFHGAPGHGTSALGVTLADRLRAAGIVAHVLHIDGVPTLSADTVLDRMAADLGTERAPRLAGVLRQPIGLAAKTRALIDDLANAPTAIVVDGAERLLVPGPADPDADAAGAGQAVAESNRWVFADGDLAGLVAACVTAVRGPWLIFASHVDFDPLAGGPPPAPGGYAPAAGGWSPGGRAEGSGAPSAQGAPHAVRPAHRAAIPPLDFAAAAQAMLRLSSLAPLPMRAVAQAPSLHRVFEAVGGNPWAMSLVARQVVDLPPNGGVRASPYVAIDAAAAGLPALARSLLISASVLDEPISRAGLQVLAGIEPGTPAARRADAAIDGLIDAGFMRVSAARPAPAAVEPGLDLPGPVRVWAGRLVGSRQRPVLARRAAAHWLGAGQPAGDVEAALIGRRYLCKSGDFVGADAVVQAVWNALLLAGQAERLVRLLGDGVATLSGERRVLALDRLAQALRALGDDAAALRVRESMLEASESTGDWRQVVGALQALARLHHDRGAVARATALVERALMVAEGMRDRAAMADCLRQLGTLHTRRGEHGRAVLCLERALDLARADGDRAQAADLLTQLAAAHAVDGDTRRAIERFEETLALQSALSNGAAMSATLHQLGQLHEAHGALDSARVCYEQARAIAETAGEAGLTALALRHLGLLHLGQRDPGRARPCFEQALALEHDAGSREGVADNHFQLGRVDELEARIDDARGRFEEALRAFERLGNGPAMVRALDRLAHLSEVGGRLDEAVACTARAMVLLNHLGSHERDAAAGTLARLRRGMAPAAFAAALRAALDDARPAARRFVPREGRRLS